MTQNPKSEIRNPKAWFRSGELVFAAVQNPKPEIRRLGFVAANWYSPLSGIRNPKSHIGVAFSGCGFTSDFGDSDFGFPASS
jgi:hypothetical protein